MHSSERMPDWELKLFILSHKKASATARSTYDHSFAVRAGRIWNVLPKIVNTQKTLASFKTSLGNFLDNVPDKPPTPGYSAENSNSIIDWCSQGGGLQIA